MSTTLCFNLYTICYNVFRVSILWKFHLVYVAQERVKLFILDSGTMLFFSRLNFLLLYSSSDIPRQLIFAVKKRFQQKKRENLLHLTSDSSYTSYNSRKCNCLKFRKFPYNKYAKLTEMNDALNVKMRMVHYS